MLDKRKQYVYNTLCVSLSETVLRLSKHKQTTGGGNPFHRLENSFPRTIMVLCCSCFKLFKHFLWHEIVSCHFF